MNNVVMTLGVASIATASALTLVAPPPSTAPPVPLTPGGTLAFVPAPAARSAAVRWSRAALGTIRHRLPGNRASAG